MGKSDQWVSISLAMVMLVHLSVWVIGYFTNKLSYLTSFVNWGFALFGIAYWTVREIKIAQHTIELREVIVLGFEVVVIVCAIYGILTGYRNNLVRIMQYIFFGIHLSVLILGLIFMLTFKMNKLI